MKWLHEDESMSDLLVVILAILGAIIILICSIHYIIKLSEPTPLTQIKRAILINYCNINHPTNISICTDFYNSSTDNEIERYWETHYGN